MVQKINPRLKRIRWIGRFGTVLLFMGGLTASQPLKMAQHLSSHGAFSVGEELVFGIGWKAASAGTATLSNQWIDSIFPVRDRFESWIDKKSLCSLGFAKRTREGAYQSDEETFLDPATGHYRKREIRLDKHGITEMTTGHFPAHVQDIVSTLYFVRTQPLKNGHPLEIAVISGDKVHPILLTLLRKETVHVPAGTFDCIVVKPSPREGSAQKATLFLWLTDTPQHIPIQIVAQLPFGELTANLIKYKLGT